MGVWSVQSKNEGTSHPADGWLKRGLGVEPGLSCNIERDRLV